MSIRKEFPQRERDFGKFIRKTIRNRLRIPSQCLIRSYLFQIWWLKFASAFSGRVGIRIRIRSRIAATAVHSGANPSRTWWYPLPSDNSSVWVCFSIQIHSTSLDTDCSPEATCAIRTKTRPITSASMSNHVCNIFCLAAIPSYVSIHICNLRGL